MQAPPHLPYVRVLVLNWNSAWFTQRCLRSLQQTDYPADRFDIVVIDNASTDGSRERLQHDFPEVGHLVNPSNLGFAEGHNRAFREALANAAGPHVDAFALVNNDAAVEPGWLMPLVAQMQAADDVGAVCPKMLLEYPYRDLELEPLEGTPVIDSVLVDGCDVTRRLLWAGLAVSVHPSAPLEFIRQVRQPSTLRIPVAATGPASHRVELRVHGGRLQVRDASGAVGDETDGVVGLDVPAQGVRRINSLGTALTEHCEGIEVGFGEADRGDLQAHEVWGWSGGGVLLRRELLETVGLFDPTWFAYYEDTDLAWRSRRAGWRTICEPASVVNHLHGGTAGSTARPFFFLNYRNWLLTVARNGTRSEQWRAFRNALHLSLPYVRRNVFGPLRRGNRPDWRITAAWLRVLLGVVESVVRVRRERNEPVGARPPEGPLLSRFMPASQSRTPGHRLGGPTLVYLDVTETLRSGWRAGIQRVTCELVRGLPTDERLDVVPIVFNKLHGRFRRVTNAEYAELLAPTGRQKPHLKLPPPPLWRRVVGRIGRAAGLARVAETVRTRRALAAEPAVLRELLIDRFDPGALFLDADATWNTRPAQREWVLPMVQEQGVRIVQVLYDILPVLRPDWFEPTNGALFVEHVRQHAEFADLVVAISDDTASTYRTWLTSEGRRVPTVEVVTLGTDLPPGVDLESVQLPAELDGARFVLTVGTIEPRKNHLVLLDAFDELRHEFPDLHLVVVGREGWRVPEVIERLHAAVAQGRVHWLNAASDAELEALYRRAFVVVTPSLSEGFGLPVAEAIARGCAVVSSNGGALVEAGGDAAEYFDPHDPATLAKILRQHLVDPDHHAQRRAISGSAPRRDWATVAARVAGLLASN